MKTIRRLGRHTALMFILICFCSQLVSSQTQVWICQSKGAYAYHVNSACSRLGRCVYGVQQMDCNTAASIGRSPCRVCTFGDCSSRTLGTETDEIAEMKQESAYEMIGRDTPAPVVTSASDKADISDQPMLDFSFIRHSIDSLRIVNQLQEQRVEQLLRDFAKFSLDHDSIVSQLKKRDSILTAQLSRMDARLTSLQVTSSESVVNATVDAAINLAPRFNQDRIQQFVTDIGLYVGITSSDAPSGWGRKGTTRYSIGAVGELVTMFDVSSSSFQNWVFRCGGYVEFFERLNVQVTAPVLNAFVSDPILDGVAGKVGYNLTSRPIVLCLFVGATHERSRNAIIPQVGIRILARGI